VVVVVSDCPVARAGRRNIQWLWVAGVRPAIVASSDPRLHPPEKEGRAVKGAPGRQRWILGDRWCAAGNPSPA